MLWFTNLVLYPHDRDFWAEHIRIFLPRSTVARDWYLSLLPHAQHAAQECTYIELFHPRLSKYRVKYSLEKVRQLELQGYGAMVLVSAKSGPTMMIKFRDAKGTYSFETPNNDANCRALYLISQHGNRYPCYTRWTERTFAVIDDLIARCKSQPEFRYMSIQIFRPRDVIPIVLTFNGLGAFHHVAKIDLEGKEWDRGGWARAISQVWPKVQRERDEKIHKIEFFFTFLVPHKSEDLYDSGLYPRNTDDANSHIPAIEMSCHGRSYLTFEFHTRFARQSEPGSDWSAVCHNHPRLFKYYPKRT